VLLVAWGALLIVVSALGIPKARAAQRLMDGARPLVAHAYLAQERALIVEGRAALKQFVDEALPRLATKLQLTDAQLRARLASTYPDVAAGITAIPGIFDRTDASLANLQRHHADFHDADTFPVAGVSRLAESIGGVFFGAVLVALGALVWFREWRWPVALALAVTLVAAVLPLAVWLPGKAHGVERMASSLNLTKQIAMKTRASFVTVEKFTTQLRDHLVSDVAAAAGTTPQALESELETGLTSLQAGIRDYPVTVRLFTPDVRLREKAYPDFQRVKDVPVVALTWAFIAGNAVVALAAAGALSTMRRRPERAPGRARERRPV
jgi:hypothetical protein